MRVLGVLALATLAAAGAVAAPPILYSRTYVSPADGSPRPYDVFLPDRADTATKRPAILFLHGAGAGKNAFELDPYTNAAAARGFVLIFWQGRLLPTNDAFSTFYVDTVNGFPDETDVLACLDDATKSFPIDLDRVSVVGWSQGGRGALLLGLQHPGRFASVVAGGAVTDLFELESWAQLLGVPFTSFPQALGGDGIGATGAVLARWLAASPRFLVANARNVPIAFFHGTDDNVVPDDTRFFPYRHAHHVADTPGFSDARGRTRTLSELHASDPPGYVFETHYLAGVGHDQTRALDATAVFDFVSAKRRSPRPVRVVAASFEEKERVFHFTRLAHHAPADGTADMIAVGADPASNRFSFSAVGSPNVTVDVAGAGLDPTRVLTLEVTTSATFVLGLFGSFPPGLTVLRDGRPVADFARDGDRLAIPIAGGPATYSVQPLAGTPVLESDLLVPALVHVSGQGGARFTTELDLANLSASDLVVDAMFLDGSGSSATLYVPPRSSGAIASSTLFTALRLSGGAAPLRLRVVLGSRDALVATSRVFNTVEGAETYGLSFPVTTAAASVLSAGTRAFVFGGTPTDPSRLNVSLFAPFEPATATVGLVSASALLLSSQTITLAQGERIQLNDVFASVAEPGKVVVSVTSGRVQIYGTVVSNSATNDPFRSAPLATSEAATSWTVPAVAAAPGRNGAVFSSDLYLAPIYETQDFSIPVDITYRPQDGAPVKVTTNVIPGTVRIIPDVLRALFPASVPGAGALEIEAVFPVEAFAVTRSRPPTGPSSQDFPCVRKGQEITNGAPAAFVGLSENEAARSNLVLVNEGPATSVVLTLLAEDGSRGTRTVDLPEGAVRQISSVTALFGASPVRAGALLVTPAPGGRVVASVARIDNSSNDPTGLAPIPIPAAYTVP